MVFINVNENNFIIKLRNIIENIKKNELVLKSKYLIKKIHNEHEYPLLYINYLIESKKIQKKKIYQFKEWLNFYIKNQHKIANNKYQNIIENIINNPPKLYKPLYKLLYKNFFIAIDIINYAEIHDLVLKIYSYKNTSIYIYSEEKLIKEININLINNILIFFEKLTNRIIKIKIIILNSPLKKYFLDYSTIYLHSINSAMTDGNAIYIYRNEELYKVLIHELIHFYNLDFKINNPSYQILFNKVKKIYNINEHDKIFESFVEAYALIIYLLFVEKYNNIKFDKLLNDEYIFTLIQISKVLKLKNYKTIDNVFTNSLTEDFKQTTSFFSYFIIKNVIISNCDIFFKFLDDNIFFNERFNDFLEIINKYDNFKNDLNYIFKFTFDNKSSRMTYNDIKI